MFRPDHLLELRWELSDPPDSVLVLLLQGRVKVDKGSKIAPVQRFVLRTGEVPQHFVFGRLPVQIQAELKVVGAEGFKNPNGVSAQDIAANENKVFLPESQFNLMG